MESKTLVDHHQDTIRSADLLDGNSLHDLKFVCPGLKAYTTSYTANALSVCRESCGGHGYAAVNRFGGWRSDHDIFQTFEGDNTVLLQQVSLPFLSEYLSTNIKTIAA